MKKIKITLTVIAIITIAFAKTNAQTITVVAAANLKVAMDSVITVFKIQNPGANVTATYGASGKLFEQITNDAPFDIFFSADMEFPSKLVEKKFAVSDVKMYAIGHLVIWSKKSDPNKNKMNSLLDEGITKIAIANPATAPYGEKAIESMKYYKVYDKIESKLVFGENIALAAQYVTSGAADIGIIALSFALTPNMQKEGGKYFIIPESSHKPLEQGCVLLKHAMGNAEAAKLFNFISSAEAIDILKYYGYSQKAK